MATMLLLLFADYLCHAERTTLVVLSSRNWAVNVNAIYLTVKASFPVSSASEMPGNITPLLDIF
jgi:hypothetical protein